MVYADRSAALQKLRISTIYEVYSLQNSYDIKSGNDLIVAS